MDLSQLALFALLGLGSGALIAGLALALVQSYQGSGIVNLALGAIAMLGAYEYYALRTLGDLFIPLPAVPLIHLGDPLGGIEAGIVALLVCAVVGVLFELLALRPLRGASPLAKLVVSLGLLLMLQGIAFEQFGNGGQSAPAVLPAGPGDVVELFGTVVPTDRFYLAGIVVLIAVMLEALYRFTRFGLTTRAAAENETSAELAGLSPQRIAIANSVMAFVLAGALGILVAPTSQLDSIVIPFAVVPALGAALLAGFTSLWIAAAAGIAMGIIQSEIIYLQSLSWFPTVGGSPLPGVADLVYFILIVVIVLLRGEALPTRGTLVEPRLPPAPSARRIFSPALIAAACGAVALVVLPFDLRAALINTLIGALVCVSLVVITGYVGQISLFQVGLGGIAGLLVSTLAVDAGIGFPLGPIIAIIVATTFGVVIALPAFRVRGVNLAILTVAGMVAIERFWLNNHVWGALRDGGATISEPRLFGLDLGPRSAFRGLDDSVPSPVFGFLCLAALLMLGILAASARRSLIGQRMMAVRANERAAASLGISPRRIKLLAFTLSSFIGSVAGVLYAYNFGSVTPAQFSTVTALSFVAFAYMGGITVVTGGLIGGVLAPAGLGAWVMHQFDVAPGYLLILGGLGLVIAVAYVPAGAALTPIGNHPPVRFARWLARPATRPIGSAIRARRPGVPSGDPVGVPQQRRDEQ